MTEKMLVQGNEAVGWGALSGGCDGFFGYPITPQNEVPEWFAREFPERGKVFVQSQSETGSINMLLGGAAAGFRVMTSTSSPGWGFAFLSIRPGGGQGLHSPELLDRKCIPIRHRRKELGFHPWDIWRMA